MAHFWPLNANQTKLSVAEAKALLSSMKQSGWQEIFDSGARHKWVQEAVEGAEVLLGTNWPGLCWLLGLAPRDRFEPLARCLSQSWVASLPMISTPRFTGANFAAQVVQQGAPLLKGMCVSHVISEIRALIREDSDAVCTLHQVAAASSNQFAHYDPDGISDTQWNEFLSRVCISSVCGMTALLPSVELKLCLIGAEHIHDCFPWREPAMTRGSRSRTTDISTGALLSNAFNVYFFARLQDVEVTAESGSRALRRVCWMLSRLRLAIVQRSRLTGQGPLALLEDDVIRMIFDFVAPRP